ncbi:MAG: hypothetical protein ACLP1Q_04390 [Solirubrobacteraceae bacterium]
MPGRCALDGIAGAGPLERLRALMEEAFVHEVAAYPNAARLVLVEAPDVGPAALVHAKRTRRLVERAIWWSLRPGSEAAAPPPLTVKRIVADGTRLVRARLCDDRTSELASELSDLCVVAAARPARTPDGHRHG